MDSLCSKSNDTVKFQLASLALFYRGTVQRTLKKVGMKIMSRTLSNAMENWIAFYKERVHQRKLVGKILRQLGNKNLSSGWKGWVDFVKKKKREEHVVR